MNFRAALIAVFCAFVATPAWAGGKCGDIQTKEEYMAKAKTLEKFAPVFEMGGDEMKFVKRSIENDNGVKVATEEMVFFGYKDVKYGPIYALVEFVGGCLSAVTNVATDADAKSLIEWLAKHLKQGKDLAENGPGRKS